MSMFTSGAAPLQNLNSFEIILNLLLAFGLGVAVAIVYRIVNRNKALNPSFLSTLIILSMVVALVMMVIGNSIARAFSLVGALSIIRFRTVVKDNRDIAFVFFALAGGMAAGIGNYRIAIYGVSVILLLILLLDFIQFGASRRGLYVMRIYLTPTDVDDDSINRIFAEYFSMKNDQSIKSIKMGQFIEQTFMIRLKRGKDLKSITAELTGIEGVERVAFLVEDSEGEI